MTGTTNNTTAAMNLSKYEFDLISKHFLYANLFFELQVQQCKTRFTFSVPCIQTVCGIGDDSTFPESSNGAFPLGGTYRFEPNTSLIYTVIIGTVKKV